MKVINNKYIQKSIDDFFINLLSLIYGKSFLSDNKIDIILIELQDNINNIQYYIYKSPAKLKWSIIWVMDKSFEYYIKEGEIKEDFELCRNLCNIQNKLDFNVEPIDGGKYESNRKYSKKGDR